MSYIDNFVIPVPKANLDKYRAMSEKSAAVWKEHGALQYSESRRRRRPARQGHVVSSQAVQLKDDETVVVGWVVYKSREDRDAIMAKVMADPAPRRHDERLEHAVHDGKRMFWGGFKSLVEHS